jgi:hypothetical protein
MSAFPPLDPLNPVEKEVLEFAGTALRASLYPDLLMPPSAWSNRSPAPQTQWVLVLSGGGAKGAFQVGAIQQLYRFGFWPRGVAATSVGSVNALAVAERSWAGLDKLTQTWLSIDSVADVYAAEPWVERVSNLRELNLDLVSMVYGSQSRSLAVDPASGPTVTSLNTKIDRTVNGFIGATWLGGMLLTPLIPIITPFAIMEIDALRDDIRALNTILGREARGLFNFGPLRRMVEPLVDPRAISDAGMPIRLVMVSLDSQRVCAVAEHGELFEYVWQPRELTHRRNRIGSLSIDRTMLTTAALASASVPVVNPPLAIATNDTGWSKHAGWMVDGGVRQILPTDQGLEILEALPPAPGVRKGIIAIGAGAVHPQAPGPPELASPPFSLVRDYRFLDIISTSFFSALDEINTDELARIRRLPDETDRMVVMPGIPVGGLTELDPGLVQILLAYGWMRAFDAVTASTRQFNDQAYERFLWGPTEQIVALRLACWRLEREARSFANEYGTELGRRTPPELMYSLSPGDSSRTAAALVDWETFKRELPTQEAFPIEIKVGEQRFAAAASADLIARIRRLKQFVDTAVSQRVRMHGLDSLPSVHELSHASVGNRNAFADWSLDWERHGISPRTFPSPYPTGPGLIDPRDGKPHKFARFTDPWAVQKRFAFTGAGRRFTLHGFFDAAMHTLQFSETPAAARPKPFSLRDPDYRIVRQEGHIFDPKVKTSDRLVPLYSAYKPATNNVTTTRAQAELPPGFGKPTTLGFVFRPDLPRPSGAVPLWTFYSPSLDDHLTTCDGARFGLEGSLGSEPRRHLQPDYRFDRLEGYVFPPGSNPTEPTVRLYRWVSFSRDDHFTTSQPVWIPQIGGLPVENSTNFVPPA